mmetsp:Transcript_6376/g.7330  ORF Transcript_6376/g.7330 Transcript_6376/m.7330 type:complete len:101 (+) Transcript_6376:462-764(+)
MFAQYSAFDLVFQSFSSKNRTVMKMYQPAKGKPINELIIPTRDGLMLFFLTRQWNKVFSGARNPALIIMLVKMSSLTPFPQVAPFDRTYKTVKQTATDDS